MVLEVWEYLRMNPMLKPGNFGGSFAFMCEKKEGPKAPLLHSTLGPALIRFDAGSRFIVYWIVDGMIHREDGPAVIEHHYSGKKEARYYLNGVYYDNTFDWSQA
jgi:hypothetical protein